MPKRCHLYIIKCKTDMAKPARQEQPAKKYNIDRQIKQLPREISVASIVKHLEQFNVSYDDFYRDRRIPFGSSKSIPSDRLMIYAQVFECSISELINNQVKATSIRAGLEAPREVPAKKSKTGLK